MEFLQILLLLSVVLQRFNSQMIEDDSEFGYHTKVGIPMAFSMKEQEENTVRISGGSLAPFSFGYQAGILITLTTGWTSICSGSLISNNKVLTAAHCWYDGNIQARTFEIVLGSIALFSGGTRVVTDEVETHPGWNPDSGTHDIAMVNIERVEFNNNIFSIALPLIADANEDFSGVVARASGFGVTSNAQNLAPSTSTLHHAELVIISNAECQKSASFLVHGSQICASGSGSGLCNGDSGGTLSLVWNFRRTLVGVASFRQSSGCGNDSPAVFTRVTAFLPWILANI